MAIELVKKSVFDSTNAELVSQLNKNTKVLSRFKADTSVSELNDLDAIFGVSGSSPYIYEFLASDKDAANGLFGGAGYSVREYRIDPKYKAQIAMTYAGYNGKKPDILFRRCVAGVWTDWDALVLRSEMNALFEQVNISNSLVNGWEIHSSSYPFLLTKTGHIVQISTVIKGGTLSAGTEIVTLPNGYRPKNIVQISVYGKNGKVFLCSILSNGILRIQNFSFDESTEYTINATYPIV